MTYIAIDLASKTAPFEQIKTSIIGLIAAGDLPTDHKLPTIRQLAGDLGVAPNTVARSYRELETLGFVRSRGRRGTVVAGLPSTSNTRTDATKLVVTAVHEARASGAESSDILTAVIAELSRSA